MPWENDFSAARNHCLRFVTGNWVLWLDAGERIRPQACGRASTFPRRTSQPCMRILALGGSAPTRGFGFGRAMPQVRLLPTRADLRFSGRVRETLERIAPSGRLPNRRGPLPHRPPPASARAPAVHGQGPARLGLGQRRGGRCRKLAAAAVAGGRSGPRYPGQSRTGPRNVAPRGRNIAAPTQPNGWRLFMDF